MDKLTTSGLESSAHRELVKGHERASPNPLILSLSKGVSGFH